MSEMKQELVMEATYGRKSKCKTEFKAVMNKVLVSGLILATLMGSTIVPTYAANVSGQFTLVDNSKITQTYGVSFDQTIVNINNTIKAINDMKAKGQVSDAQIKELASQIYSLEKATMGITLTEQNLADIEKVLNSAESAIDGLDNVQSVEIAIMLSRQFYGLSGGKDLVAEFNQKNNYGGQTKKESGLAPEIQSNGIITMRGTEAVNTDSYTANNNYAAGSTSGQLTGTQLVNSFWDVQPNDWYYTQVQAMVQRGLFAGKGPIDNGVGTFAPNDTMTKAEFITVVARMFYKDDEINNFDSGTGIWWDKYYNACVSKGIFSEYEMAYDSMEQGMSREEMSFVAINALRKLEGQSNKTYLMTNAKTVIPDYTEVSKHLQSYVVQAYADGLLCGTDAQGTFAPKDTLTRAEASTVLYRIVESDARTPKRDLYSTNQGSGNNSSHQFAENTASPITIKEGEKTLRRLAKEGDTVIKADGSKVVLKKGPNGILGEGQGVAADLGATTETNMHAGYTVTDYNKTGYVFASSVYFEDSTGTSVHNQKYFVNGITGEGHWAKEWQVILKNAKPTTTGEFNYQISPDKNFYWSDGLGEWAPIYSNSSDKLINNIRQANGL